MKLVINRCFGGFTLSDELMVMLNATDPYAYSFYSERSNENLVRLVETLGTERASGSCAQLEVVTLPDNTTDYRISDYDGVESVLYVVDGKIHSL